MTHPHTEAGARRFVARAMLGSLLTLMAVSAFGGGIYGLLGAKEIPTEWLDGSPFDSYLVPSLVLLFVIGGTQAAAAAAVFGRSRWASRLSALAGLLLLGWVWAEVIVIGYVSWLQPAMAIVAKVILVLVVIEWSHLGPRVRRTA